MLPEGRRQPLILVVDDAVEMLEYVRIVLQSAQYQVISAESGPAALELARQRLPDLILLDVQMPGMGGFAVCQALKASEVTRDIPVIFHTAMSEVEDVAKGFALGAVDYVAKPLNRHVMLARLKTHLELYGERRRLEAMFRDVLEHAPDAIFLADARGQILLANVHAEEIFGYSARELLGRPLGPLFSGIDILCQGEGMIQFECPCQPRNGPVFPGDISSGWIETHRGRMLMVTVRHAGQRKRYETELQRSRQHLRELAARAEAAREEERKHIAREVHDELGQVLTALRMDVTMFKLRFGALDPLLPQKLDEMKALIDRGIQGVRRVAVSLRPAALDMGLTAALEWLCTEASTHHGLVCALEVEGDELELDEARAVVVFRIVQESLTNVARYAQAERVEVRVSQQEGALCFEVRDNGLGFDPTEVRHQKSFGLLGMRERALALGGELHILSAPGQGTTVRASIPLRAEEALP